MALNAADALQKPLPKPLPNPPDRAAAAGAGDGAEGQAAEATDAGDAGAALGGFVVQCGKCRAIVCDSCSFVCSDEATALVTFSAVTEHVRMMEEQLQFSTEGPDIGCSFVPLACALCAQVLGRKYLTTSRALDTVRDSFSFMSSEVTSYAFGSTQSSTSVNDLCPTLQDIFDQINTISHVILSYNQRIQALEEDLAAKKANKL